MKQINIAKEYTLTPGARYKKDGAFSGEDFREKYLEPLFASGDKSQITINLDGTMGYATSFLEESFGGLVRKFGDKYTNQEIFNRFIFISDEEPACVNEIKQYILEARYSK